jgi:hypothetical protein
VTELERMLIAVQLDRSRLLNQQVAEQTTALEGRRAQVLRYETLTARLNTVLAIFPAGSAPSRLTTNNDVPQSAIHNARGAANDAALRVGWQGLDTSTLQAVRDAIAETARRTEAERQTIQMDELRLQSLVNKRNEAYALMTDFLKRLRGTR